MPQQTDKKDQKNLLWQYAGYASQMLISIGLAVFLGMYADKWLHTSMPLLIWVLPLLLIVGMLVKVIRDTGRKK